MPAHQSRSARPASGFTDHAPQSSTRDVYRQITKQIAAQIEAGAGEFRMPWHFDGTVDRPINAVSKLPYRGANVLLLWLTAQERGYGSGEYATYKQWRDKGAQVRKGEKAAPIVFWKFDDLQADAGDLAGDSAGEDRPADRLGRLVLARTYPVFNADQVDGYTRPKLRVMPVSEKIAHAEEFLDASGVRVKHGGSRAFYSPKFDEVVLPPFEKFRDPLSYYAVRAHETVHATGHEKRLHRRFGEQYGDDAYAMEELTAELGAAFVCADLKLTNQPRKDHAQYAATWLRALRHDPQALFTAASRAQTAADWLHDRHVERFMPEGSYNEETQALIGVHRRGGAVQQAAHSSFREIK